MKLRVRGTSLNDSVGCHFCGTCTPTRCCVDGSPIVCSKCPCGRAFLKSHLFMLASAVSKMSVRITGANLSLGCKRVIVKDICKGLSGSVGACPLNAVANSMVAFPLGSLFVRSGSKTSPTNGGRAGLCLDVSTCGTDLRWRGGLCGD